MKFQRGAVFVRQGLHAVQKAPALRFFGCAGESGGGITVSRRYDSLGRAIEEKETDGTDTTVNNYSYDVSGNRTEHKLTLSGEVRSWKSYTYDLLGRMKTVGERPILTEKYDYSYKIMIFTMGGYEEYARYSLSYVGDCGEYCSEFDTMEAFYWHDHENSAWYEISLDPEEPLCGEMYISSSGKMAGSIGYQDGSMICRAEEISDLSEIDPDAGTIYYVIDGTNNIRYTVFAQNNCYYLYPGSDGGFSIPTYIAGGEAEIVAEYTYDARGNILTETKENGITTYYTYNAAGLPKTVINKRGETVISGYTYAYMLDGNIKSITETSGKTVNYTYDGLGRLVKEEKLDNGTTGVISYTYDVNGNRTGKNENGVVTTYTYDANNRLISENCGGWLTTYSYDANGNRTGIFVNNNFAGTYSYDLFGKQTSYTANNIGYTYYTYRPDGLRHSVGSTKHIWDGSNIVAEKYGNSETYYTYGIGLIKSGEEYYVFNWHGDVIALTNLTGAITKTYEYDAFGVEDDIDENDPNPWRYCGEYYDKETKTLYLRARYYDIGTGSFTQEDPIKDGSNWYSYCMGSPVALTDPTGLKINWGKVFSIAVIAVTTAVTVAGVIASAGGLAVAVGAALSVSSATATTLASAAVAVVAAANVAVGLSDITEVVTEKTNPIRDYVFNGDQEAYDRAKIALSLTTAGMVEVAANAPDVKKKSAPTIEDDYDEPVHGNSAKSTKPQHGYEIYEGDTGDVVKTGISGQKLNADGSSPRANVQVNALNRKENRSPYNAYKSRVVMRDMPTRADALEWEQQNTNRLVAEKNSMCHHKRPTPKLPNNTK